MKPIALTLATALCLSLLPGASVNPGPPPRLYTAHHEYILGTSLELKLLAATEPAADRAEAAALREIARQSQLLSAWDPASEFSSWTRSTARPTAVSPELFELLDLFDSWRLRSHGALDASAEAVTQLWQRAAAENRLPTALERAAAVAQVRAPHWSLDPARRTATHLDRTPLALNSFAKSYIVERAAQAALAQPGISAAIVNIGGDLVVRGNWTEPVSVADPRSDAENAPPLDRILVRDRAIATSGSYRRGFEIQGRHYSHIVDPRTAQSVNHIVSATVVAPNAADAGALATTLCVLQPAESLALAARTPGAEFLLALNDGRRIQSPGWKRLQAAAPPLAAAAAAAPEPAPAPALWNPAFELIVNLEIARIPDPSARRPYVAVWIEDADKFPLRTLALWFDRVRWLPELKAWYHDDRLRAMAEGNDITGSLSSATRPAGKYKLKWDGKDNQGKLVPAGKYTVCIEGVREHGTYQISRRELDFNGTPKSLTHPPATELPTITLDYQKK